MSTASVAERGFLRLAATTLPVDKQVVTSYVPGLALDPLALPVTNPPFGKRPESSLRGHLLHLVQDLTAICHFFPRLRVNVKRTVCPRKLFARDVRSDASRSCTLTRGTWHFAKCGIRDIVDSKISSRRIIAYVQRRVATNRCDLSSIEKSLKHYSVNYLQMHLKSRRDNESFPSWLSTRNP